MREAVCDPRRTLRCGSVMSHPCVELPPPVNVVSESIRKRFHHAPQGGLYHASIQPVQSTTGSFSRRGVRFVGQGAPSRAQRQGLRLPDSICGHAVLSIGPRRFVARNLQRLGLLSGQTVASRHFPCPQQIHFVLRQRTSPGGAVRRLVLHFTESLPRPARPRRPQSQVPLQEQTAVVGLHYYHTLPGSVPLGQVPPSERGCEGACVVGPRRLLALLRSDYRSQEERCPRGSIAGTQCRFDRGDGPRL